MSILGFSIVGNPKITFIFFLATPTPTRAPSRGAYRGCCVLYYQIYCVMSILGFSIVKNPKMTFIFILGYPNPCKDALRGGLGA